MFRGSQSKRKIIYIDTPCYWQLNGVEKTPILVSSPSLPLLMSLFYYVKNAYIFLTRVCS